jgi:hypothetical protein
MKAISRLKALGICLLANWVNNVLDAEKRPHVGHTIIMPKFGASLPSNPERRPPHPAS